MRNFSVVLTVADHEKNGFVSLTKWPRLTEEEARRFIQAVDDKIDDESEPDIKTAEFTFILDLMEDRDLLDNGKRLLPLQIAMSLAPADVQRWLEDRPEPDSLISNPIPLGPAEALAANAEPLS